MVDFDVFRGLEKLGVKIDRFVMCILKLVMFVLFVILVVVELFRWGKVNDKDDNVNVDCDVVNDVFKLLLLISNVFIFDMLVLRL